jgi:restriction endonuclease S subunit
MLNSKSTYKYLDFVKFSQLYNWSVQYLNDSRIRFTTKYPLVQIKEFLTRNKTAITVQDEIIYQRITIRIHNGGVIPRDKVKGTEIGTKKQFRVSAGQFILSKIDARNGAMGIIPEKLDGAIVTQDFLAYNIDTTKINPQYLVLVSTTKQFMDFCQSCSSGTTNRQRVDEDKFLNIRISLPPLAEQNKLVDEYHKRIDLIKCNNDKIYSIRLCIDKYLLKKLGCDSADKSDRTTNKKILTFLSFCDISRWDVFNLQYQLQSQLYKTIQLKKLVTCKPKYGASYKTINKRSDIRYIRITDINEDGTLNNNVVSANGYDSQYLLQENDFLIARSGNTVGKTFLYKDKYGKAIYAGYLIKFVIDTNLIDPLYLLYYTKSSIYKKWILANMRVSAQPNINSEQYLESPIIVPPIDKQREIVEYVSIMLQKIETLSNTTLKYESDAINNFEDQIFE